MKNKAFFLFMLSVALSCTPKNEEVKDEQVEISPPTEALDSVANTRQDGLKTDEDVISPTLPLPPQVLQLLAQKYPGYKQPVLADATKEYMQEHDQGPYQIRGNFTNDTSQDYALQLQLGKDILIVAVTDTGGGNQTIHELKRDILFNDRGTLKSLYYLFLAEPGQTLEDQQSKVTKVLETEAVSLGLEDNVTTFVYSKNGFKAYSAISR